DGVDPALVVAHPVVCIRPDRLDVFAQLVDRHELAVLAGEEDQHRIDALLPERVVVLGALDRAGRLSTHVVVAGSGVRIGHRRHPSPYTLFTASSSGTSWSETAHDARSGLTSNSN